MINKENEIEHCGAKIKLEHSKNFQNLLKKYSSIRLLYNPEIKEKYIKYSFGGKGKEMIKLEEEIFQLDYYYSDPIPEKKSWYKKFMNWSKNE